MPDYAEVAGCSTFKNPTSPLYDSCGAYATTNLVKNANIFTNNFHNNNKSSIYSAPTSCHYNMDNNQQQHTFSYSESNFPMHNNKMATVTATQPSAVVVTAATKMNITENKMDAINNLNRSSSSTNGSVIQAQQQQQQQYPHHHMMHQQQYFGGGVSGNGLVCGSASGGIGGGSASGGSSGGNSSTGGVNGYIGTMKRNHRLPKIGHSDKLSFGGCDTGSTLEQPLYVKSKEDGSWTTVQNSTYQYQVNSNSDTNNHLIKSNNFGASSSNSNGTYVNNTNSNSASQIYLSSFGKTENV